MRGQGQRGLVENRRALVKRHTGREGLSGSRDGAIDIAGRTRWHRSDERTIERIVHFDDVSRSREGLAGQTEAMRWLSRHVSDDTDVVKTHRYLSINHDGGFIPFAHRGGTGFAPENTMAAFRHAYELGYRHLETDVHATADGVLAAFHDNDLSRTCGRPGSIGELTWSAVAEARVAGDHSIPLMSDLLEEFPDAFFNIDAKTDAAVEPLLALLHRLDCLDRVCIGSFSHRRLATIRQRARVCTSASPREVTQWLAGSIPRGPDCFQVPVSQGPIPVVTARSVARAQRAGKPVHVWTIDDPREMQRLIDLGVDGIMTDDTVVLERIARANGLWPSR